MQSYLKKKTPTKHSIHVLARYAGQAVGQLLNSTKHISTFSNTHNIYYCTEIN